ncbi:tonsoku-like protein isoform X2 [Mobula hypostoma]|uniref:tonsoku-like protein isoform X2 n=1 Tax=Mobula hypostoma TaxID=723540 RepID=UPI002FC3D1AD
MDHYEECKTWLNVAMAKEEYGRPYAELEECYQKVLQCADQAQIPCLQLVERGFREVSQLLSKQRNRLQITEPGDLRLLSDNQRDVEKLISRHQAHSSHRKVKKQ